MTQSASTPTNREDAGEASSPELIPRSRLAWLLGFVALPFLVLGVVLVVTRNEYRPISDYALMELQVRSIGHHEVLSGLYSRNDWAHPGPMFFYISAPFYWLSGGASIGLNLAAVVVNAAAVAGMGWLSWRRGRTAMLLCTLLGCALVMRTMAAELVYDPWNNFVVALPFGLVLFATWALLCGDRWALPVAVVATSFVAQTHVGFIVLAVPLLLLGTVCLVAPTLRRGSDAQRRRSVLRTLAGSAALGVVLWIPVGIDALVNHPSNLSRTLHYFRTSDEATHDVTTGWRVVIGQFTWPPEWLTSKRMILSGYGESPFKTDSALPWLLIPVVLAAVYLWRHRRTDTAGARNLAVVVVVAIGLGILAVMRTLGPVLDYRLRWTWMIPLVAFVMVAWTIWQLVAARWPVAERRVLLPIAVAGIIVVTGVNLFTASTVGVPWGPDSDVMAAITPGAVTAVDGGGQVLLTDRGDGAWYTRGLVLQLERAGIDARVPADHRVLYGKSRVLNLDEPIRANLEVLMGKEVKQALQDPSYQLVSRWQTRPHSSLAAAFRRRAQLDKELHSGRLTTEEYLRKVTTELPSPPHAPISDDVGVFINKAFGHDTAR